MPKRLHIPCLPPPPVGTPLVEAAYAALGETEGPTVPESMDAPRIPDIKSVIKTGIPLVRRDAKTFDKADRERFNRMGKAWLNGHYTGVAKRRFVKKKATRKRRAYPKRAIRKRGKNRWSYPAKYTRKYPRRY